MWWSVVVVVLVICPAVRGDVTDCDQNTCTNCIQTPACIWCSKENFTKQRCVNRATADRGNFYEECEERFVHDPVRYQKVLEDKEFSKETTDDPSASIIQIKPQKVLLEMRVGDTGTIKLKYKHLRNYPIDLYYLMDGSESMRDDKDNVANLAKKLLNRMRKITKNFRLGFGQFVDKPILPYVNTYPFDSNYYESKNQVPPYSYKHILSLTHDGKEFEKVVREFKTASNFDSPESSFDGLMQVIVCEDKIHWRDQSLHLILVLQMAST
ncbi:integrin beta-6-like [Homarus americanus]|uniref:integrin beta-6-like n=1 Tax=Homarus americanus TaxID=6706 RepID=UPI001C478A78|nr:integrin beta-6-like [Homarus americanus]